MGTDTGTSTTHARVANMAGRKPTLPWVAAIKIAWREVAASRAKFFFVILSVAIGVAALTGVRGFSESFQRTMLTEARTIMAADLSARMFRQPTDAEEKQLATLAEQGLVRTTVTEMVSMASTPAETIPLLISLKAVDPAQYPFYGKAVLDPAGDLRTVLTDTTALVGEDLLIRLHARVGDTLKLGGENFRIAAVLVREPDRMSASMNLGPRVMITRAALDRTGLLQAGSRSGERLLFKVQPRSQVQAGSKVQAKSQSQSQTGNIAKLRAELEKILPDAQVTDFRESNPALTQGLDRSTSLLSLICLVAMVLGAIGVAMAMRAHLQQRIDILAIMKSIGARSSDILRIYLFQTLMLGLAGGLLGVFLGLGVEWVFPLVLGKLLPMQTDLHVPVKSILAGLGTGVLTTLLFCLPPLLDIRKVRPSLVLRRAVDEGSSEEKVGFWKAIWNNKAQWIATLLVVLALAGIATALSDSVIVGKWFAAALFVVLAVLLGLAAGTLKLLRAFLSKTRLHLPSSIRHGLANLYRPGNQSAAVLAALGTGVMLILTVFLMQKSVIEEISLTASPKIPNVFLVDIGTQELAGVKELLSRTPGVRGQIEALPIVSGRITAVDGVPAESLKLTNFPRRLLQSATLTWAETKPDGDKIIDGQWWSRGDEHAVAVSDHIAQRLHLHAGSRIDFASGEKSIRTRVAAVFKSDGQHVYGRSEYVLAPAALKGLPVVWYGAVHVDTNQVGQMQRALYVAYPTVTVVNIADVLDTIQGVVRQITVVVRFLAAFSMLSGAIILASSVASTRFRRIREVVVLKTLGATRNRIVAVFSVEFMVLGLLAAFVGVIFANLLTRVLLHRLDVVFHIEWAATLIALVGTAALAVTTGWIASYRILGQKPLQILREE